MSGSRSRGGSSAMQKVVIAVGVLVALLLAANLLKGFLPVWLEGEEEPEGFLTKENFMAAAYWLPVGCGILFTLVGAFWATKGYAESESRSVLWLRRVLVCGFVALVGLATATFDPEMFERQTLAVVAAWGFGLVLFPAVMGAWKSSRKGSHGRGKSRGKRKRKQSSRASSAGEMERTSAEVDV